MQFSLGLCHGDFCITERETPMVKWVYMWDYTKSTFMSLHLFHIKRIVSINFESFFFRIMSWGFLHDRERDTHGKMGIYVGLHKVNLASLFS